jgi:hypothetical protein
MALLILSVNISSSQVTVHCLLGVFRNVILMLFIYEDLWGSTVNSVCRNQLIMLNLCVDMSSDGGELRMDHPGYGVRLEEPPSGNTEGK